MAVKVDRADVRRLMSRQEAVLLEVLPAHEYDEEHLPGAINVPLKELDWESVKGLDPAKPVIVCCWDALCDMSPRAARRLDEFGFERVHDYAAGKVDWMAAGLPTVRRTGERRARDEIEPSLTCRPSTPIEDLPEEHVVVVDEADVVLGVVEPRADGPSSTAQEVMRLGPATVRAHEPLDPLIERMTARQVTQVIVTTPEGVLLGVIRRT